MDTSALVQYFDAEVQGALILLGMAVASAGLGGWLWLSRARYAAMAFPLVILGLVELGVGITLAMRTPAQVEALQQGLQETRAETLPAEIARMDKVKRSFEIVKIAEVVFIVISLGLILAPLGDVARGVGFGLLLEAVALLCFDYVAHERALVYSDWLRSLPLA